MEYVDPERPSQSQYDEIATMALNAFTRLSGCDAIRTKELVDALNIRVIEEDLFSCDILVRAPFVINSLHTLNLRTGNTNTVEIPSIFDDTTVGGNFVGFRAVSHSGGKTLMYQLESTMDPVTMSYTTAILPVEGSRILSRDFNKDEADHINETMRGSLEALEMVKDPGFKELLAEFVEAMIDKDVVDAFYFAQLGAIAQDMLKHHEVSGVKDKELAITKLIGSQLDHGLVYAVTGHLFMPEDLSGKKSAGIDHVRMVTPISGVQLINNYSINRITATLQVEDTQQLAFIILDEDGTKRVVPLMHIEELTIYDTIAD